MAEQSRKFEVEIGEGDQKKKVALMVKRPDQDTLQKAQLVYNRTFREAVKPEDGGKGALVRAALDSVLREQHLWDDSKEKRFKELVEALNEGEKRLAKGRIKLSEGREIALQMRRDRAEMRALLTDRNVLDQNTAEAQAENAKFNYLVAACCVDQAKGKPYFKDVDDYNRKGDDPVAGEAAKEFATLFYGLNPEHEQSLAENKWLRAYSYADKEGRLIDRETGHYVDTRGRRIDKEGFLLSEDGRRIAEDGTPLDDNGDYLLDDAAPFLDDDGNPVEVPEEFRKAPKAETAPPTESVASKSEAAPQETPSLQTVA